MDTARKALAQARKKAATVRKKRLSGVTSKIIVGTATCGVAAGARQVVEAFREEIKARKLKHVAVTETGCSGRCNLEPLVQVNVEGEAPILYYEITPERARRIVAQHIVNREPVREWALS